MAETKTTKQLREPDHPDPAGTYRSGADPGGQAKPITLTDPGDDVPTAADRAHRATQPKAFSYAGSGATDPVELDPATHGSHYRGATGDV